MRNKSYIKVNVHISKQRFHSFLNFIKIILEIDNESNFNEAMKAEKFNIYYLSGKKQIKF